MNVIVAVSQGIGIVTTERGVEIDIAEAHVFDFFAGKVARTPSDVEAAFG
jgi:hypothetical protein